MYQALYRKWRPKTFSDVVGQQHITDTLRRQVAEGRLSHAYLFTGTRGTGKTTCAKILAKAVNCQHPVDGDPCNCCPSCLGIESGSFLDVLELDAASNNGVDQVRALRDEAIYAPANVRKRVYIVDEVHMLSTAAFNALLKILEEPPEHLMFILATTELHKVPATILSRCQRFSFKRIQPEDIAQRLGYIAQQEKIDLTEDAAQLLSRMADGALRDALSLLDQCTAMEGRIDSAAVLEVLGLAGNIQTAQLMERILRRDVQDALLQLDHLYHAGKDVGAILNELSTLCRDLLIEKTAPKGGSALLSGGYDPAAMKQLSALCDGRHLLFMAAQLQQASAGLLQSSNRRTDAELCLLRLCDDSLCGDMDALNARISRLESAVEQGEMHFPAERPQPVSRETVQRQPVSDEKIQEKPPWEPEEPPQMQPPARMREEELPKQPLQHAEEQRTTEEMTGGSGLWETMLNSCKAKLNVRKRVFLNMAHGVCQGDALVIYCNSQLAADQLQDNEVLSVLKTGAAAAAGRTVPLRFEVGTAPVSGGKAPKESSVSKKQASSMEKNAIPQDEPGREAASSSSAEQEDKLKKLIDFGKQLDNFKLQ